MEKIPMEWIEKLFNCMELFYGDRWTSQFKDEHAIEFAKVEWQSALYSLPYEIIKSTLIYCKSHAKDSYYKPPTRLEFYKWASKKNTPYCIDKIHEKTKSSNDVAIAALKEIREKLNNKRA